MKQKCDLDDRLCAKIVTLNKSISNEESEKVSQLNVVILSDQLIAVF